MDKKLERQLMLSIKNRLAQRDHDKRYKYAVRKRRNDAPICIYHEIEISRESPALPYVVMKKHCIVTLADGVHYIGAVRLDTQEMVYVCFYHNTLGASPNPWKTFDIFDPACFDNIIAYVDEMERYVEDTIYEPCERNLYDPTCIDDIVHWVDELEVISKERIPCSQ